MSPAEVLFECARCDDLETLVSTLRDNHLDISSVLDENRNTLCHYSAANNSTQVLQHLLSIATPEYINLQNESGNTALHWASINGHTAVVKMLLEKGSNPLICNKYDVSPVDEALRKEFWEIVEIYSSFAKRDE